MTLDHTIRNAIGKTLAAGSALYIGLAGLPGMADKDQVQVSQQPPAAEQQVQGSYLEQAAQDLFNSAQEHLGENTAEAGENDYEMPPDSKLKEYLKQPVEDTLGKEGVDYIEVDDENYDEIVKNSNIPAFVLFYVDNDEHGYTNPSRGLAGLAKVLNDTFQEDNVREGYAGDRILFCAYQITEGSSNSPEDLHDLRDKYPIEKTPGIAFYAINNNNVECIGTYDGGPSELDRLKKDIKDYVELIPNHLL